MGGLSWWHWLIILAVFILLFGAKQLPDAARGVGRSLRILKSEVSAMHDDEQAKRVTPPRPTSTAADGRRRRRRSPVRRRSTAVAPPPASTVRSQTVDPVDTGPEESGGRDGRCPSTVPSR